MPKYEVEYAQFTKVKINADNRREAEELASVMDAEEIAEYDTHDYSVWDIQQID